jgi:hypothetical protein
MLAMFRLANFLLAVSVSITVGFAQAPPGDPFDPAKHPNPIVTYVGLAAFQPSTFANAQDAAGIDVIGLSESEGARQSLDLADASVRKVRILGRNVDVTFYPVVRQKFELKRGGDLVIYSFKNPKSSVPPPILDQAAFAKTKNPAEARFGTAPPPERLDIRGSPALLFEKDGQITVFWQEDGVCHTATASMPRRDLLRLLDDLL